MTRLTEAPFRDADAAVRWALVALATPIVQISSLGRWRGKETAPGGLSPQERHGQAVQIIALLESLPELECAYVLAKHLPQRGSAHQRSGEVSRELANHGGARAMRGAEHQGRRQVFVILAQWVRQSVPTCGNAQACQMIVEQYFTGRSAYRPLRMLLQVRTAEALAVRRESYVALQRLEAEASRLLYQVMLGAGFVSNQG